MIDFESFYITFSKRSLKDLNESVEKKKKKLLNEHNNYSFKSFEKVGVESLLKCHRRCPQSLVKTLLIPFLRQVPRKTSNSNLYLISQKSVSILWRNFKEKFDVIINLFFSFLFLHYMLEQRNIKFL